MSELPRIRLTTPQRREASSSVTTVEPDPDNRPHGRRRLRASVEEVWELGQLGEARALVGTAEYSTTFEPYDLSAGAEMAHVMTERDGDKHEGVADRSS